MVGRKRSESSRHAILKAAFNALISKDYKSVSIESIARAAGVGKQTIYRWWPSKGALLLEALVNHAEETINEPQSPDRGENIRLFLSSTFHRLTEAKGSGNAVRRLMAQAQLDPEFLITFREDFIKARRDALRRVLRGDQKTETLGLEDENFLLDIIFGAMWYRLLIGHGELNDAFAQRLADLVVRELDRIQTRSEQSS